MRVLVGMSGGIDSAFSAILLKERGFSVVGVYMKLHDNEEYHKKNFERAKRVAKFLDIDIKFLDLSEDFKKEVYDYFVDTYKKGLTPNPCVKCNRTIKFGAMVEFAKSLDIEKVATGHYLKCDGEFFYKAKDKSKDQSYFVAQVKKEVLPNLIFPLGDLLKSEIKKEISKIEYLMDFATQKESSEICFVEDSYIDILKEHIDIDIKGETLNSAGEVVGSHRGYMHYTIGKRRGFEVRGASTPHYVLSINPEKNQIVVGSRDELRVDSFKIEKINMFDTLEEFEASVKIRYRTKDVPCRVKIKDDNGLVELLEPVFGLAKGQVAVFYDGDRVLGSGIII
jgi:tRNA-specific 2-thiouridylase